MLDSIINVRLISHPINWLIVGAIIMVWGMLLTAVSEHFKAGGTCGCDHGVPD